MGPHEQLDATRLLDADDVADMLCLSVKTVYGRVYDRRMPHLKPSRPSRVTGEATSKRGLTNRPFRLAAIGPSTIGSSRTGREFADARSNWTPSTHLASS